MLLKCRFLSKTTIKDLKVNKNLLELETKCPFMIHARKEINSGTSVKLEASNKVKQNREGKMIYKIKEYYKILIYFIFLIIQSNKSALYSMKHQCRFQLVRRNLKI